MKDFFFKPNFFKEILRALVFIPAFVTGWFIAELFKLNPKPSVDACIIIVTIGLLYLSWVMAYIILKSKNQN